MAAFDDGADRKRFEDWKKKYDKEYKSLDEEEIRFSAFKETLRIVDAHFADPNRKNYWMGLGPFADMTTYQFITEYIGWNPEGQPISDSDSDEGEGESKVEGEVEGEGEGEVEGESKVEGKGESKVVGVGEGKVEGRVPVKRP